MNRRHQNYIALKAQLYHADPNHLLPYLPYRPGSLLPAGDGRRRGLLLRILPPLETLAAGSRADPDPGLAGAAQGPVRAGRGPAARAPSPLPREDAPAHLLRLRRALCRHLHRRGRALWRAPVRRPLALSRRVLSLLQGGAGPLRAGPDGGNDPGGGPALPRAPAQSRTRGEGRRLPVLAVRRPVHRLSAGGRGAGLRAGPRAIRRLLARRQPLRPAAAGLEPTLVSGPLVAPHAVRAERDRDPAVRAMAAPVRHSPNGHPAARTADGRARAGH